MAARPREHGMLPGVVVRMPVGAYAGSGGWLDTGRLTAGESGWSASWLDLPCRTRFGSTIGPSSWPSPVSAGPSPRRGPAKGCRRKAWRLAAGSTRPPSRVSSAARRPDSDSTGLRRSSPPSASIGSRSICSTDPAGSEDGSGSPGHAPTGIADATRFRRPRSRSVRSCTHGHGGDDPLPVLTLGAHVRADAWSRADPEISPPGRSPRRSWRPSRLPGRPSSRAAGRARRR